MDHFIDLGNETTTFKNTGHENEERNGGQKVIDHKAKNPGRNNVHGGGSLKECREDHSYRPTREGDRESQ
jgi:hypothetical protein